MTDTALTGAAPPSDAGLVPSPFDCYLAFRGLRTLHVRMPRHMRNALTVATFLEQHPCVEKVLYPGLPSHPQVRAGVKIYNLELLEHEMSAVQVAFRV